MKRACGCTYKPEFANEEEGVKNLHVYVSAWVIDKPCEHHRDVWKSQQAFQRELREAQL